MTAPHLRSRSSDVHGHERERCLALSSGVRPSWSTACTSAPRTISTLVAPSVPLNAAMCSGVASTLLDGACRLAPCASSSATVSVLSLCDAL